MRDGQTRSAIAIHLTSYKACAFLVFIIINNAIIGITPFLVETKALLFEIPCKQTALDTEPAVQIKISMKKTDAASRRQKKRG